MVSHEKALITVCSKYVACLKILIDFLISDNIMEIMASEEDAGDQLKKITIQNGYSFKLRALMGEPKSKSLSELIETAKALRTFSLEIGEIEILPPKLLKGRL
ncbi:hypothetical protein C0584_00690 [Candidatus Parcubacteria bacterium]|nr:MAG: hypothetical protein C0584_00690 [Candidatus Parcubacteria bacterium]